MLPLIAGNKQRSELAFLYECQQMTHDLASKGWSLPQNRLNTLSITIRRSC